MISIETVLAIFLSMFALGILILLFLLPILPVWGSYSVVSECMKYLAKRTNFALFQVAAIVSILSCSFLGVIWQDSGIVCLINLAAYSAMTFYTLIFQPIERSVPRTSNYERNKIFVRLAFLFPALITLLTTLICTTMLLVAVVNMLME